MTYDVVRAILAPPIRLLWRLEVRGVEQLPPGGYVVAANHASLLDPFFLGTAIPRPLRFLAKEELWRGPVGWMMDRLGGVPVRRGIGDREALRRLQEAIEGGEVVGLFPQGTVLGPPDRPWHRGAAKLALATGAPIVPARIVDSEKALRPAKVRVGFPRVKVLLGQPITVERAPATVAAARSLTERVRAEISALRL